MSDQTQSAQAGAVPASIKFKDMSLVQKGAFFAKAILCICSFGFLFSHVFSDH